MAKVSKLNKKELKQLNTIKKAYSYIGQFSFYPSDDKRDIFRKLSTIVEYYKL